jgi:hypothetical protein
MALGPKHVVQRQRRECCAVGGIRGNLVSLNQHAKCMGSQYRSNLQTSATPLQKDAHVHHRKRSRDRKHSQRESIASSSKIFAV